MTLKRSFIIAFTIATFSCLPGIAQEYVFKVLANKGENSIFKSSKNETLALRTGGVVEANDKIIAGEGAYIGFVHVSGRTTEITAAGSYRVEDLETLLKTKPASVSSRYAEFVLNKLKEDDGVANYRSSMVATGAVERATDLAVIKLKIPEKAFVFRNDVALTWQPLPTSADYTVSVKNIFGEEILTSETPDNSFVLDFGDEKLAGERFVTVSVTSGDGAGSGDYSIKLMSKADAEKVNDELTQLQGELTQDAPLHKIILATFFEEKGLILDAMALYQEAIEMSPDVSDYLDMYNSFLKQHGLGE